MKKLWNGYLRNGRKSQKSEEIYDKLEEKFNRNIIQKLRNKNPK